MYPGLAWFAYRQLVMPLSGGGPGGGGNPGGCPEEEVQEELREELQEESCDPGPFRGRGGALGVWSSICILGNRVLNPDVQGCVRKSTSCFKASRVAKSVPETGQVA